MTRYTDFWKLCHKTPVGSFTTRTYAVTLAASFSTNGVPLSLMDCWNNFRSSQNRVKPQSASSALKRWCATMEPGSQPGSSKYYISYFGDRKRAAYHGWYIAKGHFYSREPKQIVHKHTNHPGVTSRSRVRGRKTHVRHRSRMGKTGRAYIFRD